MDYTPPPASPETNVAPVPVMAAAPRTPSAIAFLAAVLLFFLPFVDIKCNNMSLQTVSGIQLATGFKMKNSGSENNFMNDNAVNEEKGSVKDGGKKDQRSPNIFALVALALGVVGAGLSFTNSRAAVGAAMVAAIGSAASLVVMFIDLKQNTKTSIPSASGKENGLEDFGRSLSEKINVTIEFTPWFYAAVVAFLAAAFFSFRRMRSLR